MSVPVWVNMPKRRARSFSLHCARRRELYSSSVSGSSFGSVSSSRRYGSARGPSAVESEIEMLLSRFIMMPVKRLRVV